MYFNKTFENYSHYLFGECNERDEFIEPPIDITFAYKQILNLNGVQCSLVEMQTVDGNDKKIFFLSVTDKWIKIFSHSFFPLVNNISSVPDYAPHFWQTLWTRDFTKASHDTIIKGTFPVPIETDTGIFVIFAKSEFRYRYRYESLRDLYFSSRWNPSPILAKGTKVIFESSVTLTAKDYKFLRIPNSTAERLGLKFNYPEFYFNDDKSSYLDEIEMEVYNVENYGIIYIKLRHKKIVSNKTFIYASKGHYKLDY
ncbi:MAG: hypothetical protein N2517_07465 [Ignavibacteria bacterium]|nr:hypothetical protein [Ignavibacteria bacterium]